MKVSPGVTDQAGGGCLADHDDSRVQRARPPRETGAALGEVGTATAVVGEGVAAVGELRHVLVGGADHGMKIWPRSASVSLPTAPLGRVKR